jgi:hypothetical protein
MTCYRPAARRASGGARCSGQPPAWLNRVAAPRHRRCQHAQRAGPAPAGWAARQVPARGGLRPSLRDQECKCAPTSSSDVDSRRVLAQRRALVQRLFHRVLRRRAGSGGAGRTRGRSGWQLLAARAAPPARCWSSRRASARLGRCRCRQDAPRRVARTPCFGSICAQVAEVSVRAGALRVHRVVCALDCGVAVHPDGVRAQMEEVGGVRLGAVLRGQITVRNGAVEQANFRPTTCCGCTRCRAWRRT